MPVGSWGVVVSIISAAWCLASRLRLASDPVDRAVAGGRGQPAAGIGRYAVARPPLDGRQQRLAGRLLGDVDVAEAADQRGDDPAVLLAVDPLDRRARAIHPRRALCLEGTDLDLARQALDASVAHSSAASRSGSSRIQKPPSHSLDSANGPSVTTGSAPVLSTVVVASMGQQSAREHPAPGVLHLLVEASSASNIGCISSRVCGHRGGRPRCGARRACTGSSLSSMGGPVRVRPLLPRTARPRTTPFPKSRRTPTVSAMSAPEFRLSNTVLGRTDPPGLAEFYRELLGWVATRTGAEWVVIKPGGGSGPLLPARGGHEPPTWPTEPGNQQMQLHLDIGVDDLDAGVARAEGLGARLGRVAAPGRRAGAARPGRPPLLPVRAGAMKFALVGTVQP